MLVVRGRLDRSPPDRWSAALSEGEKARGAQFSREEGARRFLRGRAWLRGVLAECVGLRPEELIFDEGSRGKPRLAAGGPGFSLSHSGELVVIAVAREGEVGIDVERVRPRRSLEHLARAVLQERERRRMIELEEAERLAYVLGRFTLKEAIAKASGQGLTSAALRIDPGEVATCRASTAEPEWMSFDGGSVIHLNVGDCAVGALALRHTGDGPGRPGIEYRELP